MHYSLVVIIYVASSLCSLVCDIHDRVVHTVMISYIYVRQYRRNEMRFALEARHQKNMISMCVITRNRNAKGATAGFCSKAKECVQEDRISHSTTGKMKVKSGEMKRSTNTPITSCFLNLT